MNDWYKMFPVDWNDGTTNLTLEQEAAYLRICNAIYISNGPIPNNKFVLAGLFRCNDRRAQRLISELIEAGKIFVDGGSISNRRAIDEVSTRNRLAIDRESAGRRGGIESGKARSKSLKNNNAAQASASSKTKQIREDKNRRDSVSPNGDRGTPRKMLEAVLDAEHANDIIEHRDRIRKPMTAKAAKMLADKLATFDDPNKAADFMIERGWQSIDREWVENHFRQQRQRHGGSKPKNANDMLHEMMEGMDHAGANESGVNQQTTGQLSFAPGERDGS